MDGIHPENPEGLEPMENVPSQKERIVSHRKPQPHPNANFQAQAGKLLVSGKIRFLCLLPSAQMVGPNTVALVPSEMTRFCLKHVLCPGFDSKFYVLHCYILR